MKKIILFFGILLASLGLSASGMVDAFINTRSLYLEQINSQKSSVSSRYSTRAYIQFSKFLVTQMVEHEFLTEKDINKCDITGIFRFYIEALKIAGVEIDSRRFYTEMLPGVSFCFKCPQEAKSLSSFCITLAE